MAVWWTEEYPVTQPFFRKGDTMKVCILGLGYIGLPSALLFASKGLQVHGVDIDTELIDKLSNQLLPFREPGLKELFTNVIETETFTFSPEPCTADAFIISVPTPLDKDNRANLNFVKTAAKMICPFLQKGNLVVLESTVPPKTVDEVLTPLLSATGLVIGEELFIAHSPERVIPGDLLREMVENDRIIGGINEESAEKAANLYRHFVKGKIHLTDAITSEMVKLMENTYRDVNIALANEFALIAEKEKFNIWEAISLANQHPRVNILNPGPGVGGHCIAVDPWFIIEKAPDQARLIRKARFINDRMPYCIADKIAKIVNQIPDPVISLLGLTYKGDVDDMRESPSLKVLQLLKEIPVSVKVFDPNVDKKVLDEQVDSLEEVLKDTDCCVILTNHTLFKEIDFKKYLNNFRTKNIFDTRNSINYCGLAEDGFTVYQLGLS